MAFPLAWQNIFLCLCHCLPFCHCLALCHYLPLCHCLWLKLACYSHYVSHWHPLQWSRLGIVHHPSASHFFRNQDSSFVNLRFNLLSPSTLPPPPLHLYLWWNLFCWCGNNPACFSQQKSLSNVFSVYILQYTDTAVDISALLLRPSNV